MNDSTGNHNKNPIKAAVVILFAIALSIGVYLNLVDAYEVQRDSVLESMYADEKYITSVSEKLDVEKEDVTFELGDRGELLYHTSKGTFYARLTGSKIDYLMEIPY